MKAGDSVVIIGAGGGIGFELVAELFERGLRVFGADQCETRLEQIKVEMAKRGQVFEYGVVDVCDLNSLLRLTEKIKKHFDRVDFWINGAGVALNKAFSQQSSEEFFRVMDVNFDGVVRSSKIALELMSEQASGQIVNIASVAGHVAAPFMSSYVASKFAVVGFTRSLQTELAFANSPVLVQLVSPGFVKTKMIKIGEKMGFPDWLQFMLSEPRDVALAICKAMQTKKLETVATMNGRLMLGMHRFFPKVTRNSSKVLLTRSWQDVLLNRYHID